MWPPTTMNWINVIYSHSLIYFCWQHNTPSWLCWTSANWNDQLIGWWYFLNSNVWFTYLHTLVEVKTIYFLALLLVLSRGRCTAPLKSSSTRAISTVGAKKTPTKQQNMSPSILFLCHTSSVTSLTASWWITPFSVRDGHRGVATLRVEETAVV